MKDTIWQGNPQLMTSLDGKQKGMKKVLEERGIITTGMTAPKMREMLKTYPDFCNSISLLEELVISKGHLCFFLPKFHCELNPIERCWCHAKRHTRAYCNGSIVRLRKIVPEGFTTVSKDLITSYFLTCRDFERAYVAGNTCKTVDKAVKIYKSHRRVSK